MRSVRDALQLAANQDRVLIEWMSDNHDHPDLLTYGQVRNWIIRIHRTLTDAGAGKKIGLVGANTPGWIAADLALLTGHYVEIPVPLAFSAEQARSMLRDADTCLVDRAGIRRLAEWGLDKSMTVLAVGDPPGSEDPVLGVLPDEPASDRVIKIIHTSGTTGSPKGVKIRRDALDILAESVNAAIPSGTFARYLSLVPFSLLIEQMAAIYMPINQGGRVVLLPEATALLGTAASRAADVPGWLRAACPSASVLPPAAVSELAKAVAKSGGNLRAVLGATDPFLMAGGAPVNPRELELLDDAGLRIYEGYGLSENSSVVAWNRPDACRLGTVGQPLPHCSVRLFDGGELLVKSASLFAGYTDEDPTSVPVDSQGWLHTGDRAEIDADGYIRILGRLKNVIITSHGRNISPEWVESRLRACPGVNDAVVFGEGMEHLVALLLTADGTEADEVRVRAADLASKHLAETDQPEEYIIIQDNAELRSRYFTVTGRPRREMILSDLITVNNSI